MPSEIFDECMQSFGGIYIKCSVSRLIIIMNVTNKIGLIVRIWLIPYKGQRNFVIFLSSVVVVWILFMDNV